MNVCIMGSPPSLSVGLPFGEGQGGSLLWFSLNQVRGKKQRHQIIYLGECVDRYENVKESPMLTTITSPKFSPFGDFLKA